MSSSNLMGAADGRSGDAEAIERFFVLFFTQKYKFTFRKAQLEAKRLKLEELRNRKMVVDKEQKNNQRREQQQAGGSRQGCFSNNSKIIGTCFIFTITSI
jgi:hypothetical protein